MRPSFQQSSTFAEPGKDLGAENQHRNQPRHCFVGASQYFCRSSKACRSCAPAIQSLSLAEQDLAINYKWINYKF